MLLPLHCQSLFLLQKMWFGETQWRRCMRLWAPIHLILSRQCAYVSVDFLDGGWDALENCWFSSWFKSHIQCIPQVIFFSCSRLRHCRTSLSMRQSSPDWKSSFRLLLTLIISSSCEDPWPSSSPLPESASSVFGSWSTWAMYICCRKKREMKWDVKI